MIPDTFHTIVIGAGSGGLTVAIGLANLGKRVALIEASHVGGDCTNVGCVPSKTLIHLANAAGVSSDSQRVLATVQHKRDRLREKETEEVGHTLNLTLIHGRAQLRTSRTVHVTLADGGECTIAASNIVVATGARPRQISIAGLPPDRMLTNETIFELTQAPHHLAIIGGGVIGVELAFAFGKLGSRVSVIDMAPRVLTPYIPEAAEVIEAALRVQGVAVYTSAGVQAYDPTQQTLHIERAGQAITLDDVDYVLVAIGRQRNLTGLGLEEVGVPFSPRTGIPVDSYGRTIIPGVYAIGDVTTDSAFTHSANAQGRRVVQRIAFPVLPARSPKPLYPTATFSDPEVASAGLSQAQITERYHPALIKRIRIDFANLDRGYTDDVDQGFIIVDTIRLTGQILAATIVGTRASEMISLFTLAIGEGISLYRLYRTVYPYPTYSGGVQKVADAFLRETLSNLRTELLAYLRYRWARSPQQPSAGLPSRTAASTPAPPAT